MRESWRGRQQRSPAGDEPGGQRAEKKVGAENESGNTARSTAADLEESKEQEDESIDRLESLRLDVDLLEAEVQSRVATMRIHEFQMSVTDSDFEHRS